MTRAFSVITNLRMYLFEALLDTRTVRMRSGGRMLVCVCPLSPAGGYLHNLYWNLNDTVLRLKGFSLRKHAAAITRLSDERWYLNCGRGYEGGNLDQILSPGFKYFYRFSSHLSIWMGLAVMWHKLLLSAEWVSRRVKRHYCEVLDVTFAR